MTLKQKLEERLKIALKAGNKAEVSVVRLTLSEILKNEKDARRPLDEKEETQLLRAAVKKRKEAIELFRKGGREDLAGREEAEVTFLEEYLPAPLPSADLHRVIDESIGEMGATSIRDMGRAMKLIMPRLEGRADGSLVSRLVREKLDR